MTELDIIIVSHNTRDDLHRCLQSLHEAQPRVPSHVVVVDNASGDGSAAMVRTAWPDVRVIETGGTSASPAPTILACGPHRARWS